MISLKKWGCSGVQRSAQHKLVWTNPPVKGEGGNWSIPVSGDDVLRGAGLYRCAAPPRGRDKPRRTGTFHTTCGSNTVPPMRLSRRALLAATTAAASLPSAASASERPTRLRTGFERLAADGYSVLEGQKVGIVTNPTGITRDARHIVDVMHADDRVNLIAVFGPEHGFHHRSPSTAAHLRRSD